VAGYDTSKNVMTFTMRTLLDYPEIYARCATDLDYCGKVVEEARSSRNLRELPFIWPPAKDTSTTGPMIWTIRPLPVTVFGAAI